MKKFIACVLAFCAAIALASCSLAKSKEEVETVEFTVGVVDGAPSLAVADILGGFEFEKKDGNKKTVYKTSVDLLGGAAEIRAGVLNGTYAMAIVPLNLACAMYNAMPDLGLKLATVNVFGCLYVIGDDEVSDFSAFRGKTVMTVGAGGTPDVIFRNLLLKHGVEINGEDESSSEKVTLAYADGAPGIMSAFKSGSCDYAVLGEPAVNTMTKALGKTISLDVQKEWSKVYPDVGFVQAGLCVSSAVSEHAEYLDSLIVKLSENKEYIYENVGNLKSVFAAAESSLKSVDFTSELLDRCNVGCKKASEIKSEVNAFLQAVYDFNKQQVGGKMPDDAFFL